MPLQKYHFVDNHGHPLEGCQEYRELLARCAGLERELEQQSPHRIRLHNDLLGSQAMLEESIKERGALQAKLAVAEAALRHTCKHLCQWKDACEVGCPVSAALADTTTDEV